jgi:Na+/H+-dicarboxylate symporter
MAEGDVLQIVVFSILFALRVSNTFEQQQAGTPAFSRTNVVQDKALPRTPVTPAILPPTPAQAAATTAPATA